MACCAFAVFLLAQLLAPFVWVRRALMGDTRADNAAVAWAQIVNVLEPSPELAYHVLKAWAALATGEELHELHEAWVEEAKIHAECAAAAERGAA